MNSPESIFQTLHREYHSMVCTLCRGFVKGDLDLAADLTQDVFINVWNALPGYRAEASYKTWIYRITVNTCLLQIRKDKKRISVPLETAVLSSKADIQEKQNETDHILYRAIGKLEEIERLIIMMVLEEVKYEEIASILGITENHLRVKIHRIKSRLKKLIEDERRKG